jgi:ABC-2 type transport system permease protein
MYKRIYSLFRQDLVNTLRDNLLLYILFAPLLLAFGAKMFLPSLDQSSLVFAVQAGIDPKTINRLEKIGSVQVYPDAEAVKARVLRSDDVPGLVINSQSPVLVLEGNESESPEVFSMLVGSALSGEEAASFTWIQNEGSRSLLLEYSTIIFILIGILLGALVMAFNIIEDKETRAIKALGVSPLSMVELTLSRGLFALVISLFLVFCMTAILIGTQVNYGLLMIAFLFSITLPILISYLIGGLADSQLKAGAILKFFMLVYLTLPIITIFIPRQWHVFFYILPNYWMWQTFESVIIGPTGGFGLWISGTVTLISSLVLVILLLPVLRRQLKLR